MNDLVVSALRVPQLTKVSTPPTTPLKVAASDFFVVSVTFSLVTEIGVVVPGNISACAKLPLSSALTSSQCASLKPPSPSAFPHVTPVVLIDFAAKALPANRAQRKSAL